MRTGGDPRSLLPSIRSRIWSQDKKLAIADVATMDEILAAGLARPRFSMSLLTIFAGLRCCSQPSGRRHVVRGGAADSRDRRPDDARRQGRRRFARRDGAANRDGVAGAAALSRVMAGLLFGVRPHDPVTFAAVPLFPAAVTLLACYFPARRAASVDPAIALRHQ